MSKITEDSSYSAGGLTVKVKKIPFGTRWIKDCPAEGFKKGDLYKADRLLCGGSGKIEGITIHNTDDSADAETYTLATFNQNMNSARVHFYVDDREAWQNLELNEVGWHAGTGNMGSGNENTVALEIIMGGSRSEKDRRAERNGALLTAYLLKITGLGIESIYTHRDWSGKNCPAYILPHWDEFIELVKEYCSVLEEEKNSFAECCKACCEKNGERLSNAAEKDGNTPDAYAKQAVSKAVEEGALIGDSAGNLNLHSPLSRQDLFVILDRLGVM